MIRSIQIKLIAGLGCEFEQLGDGLAFGCEGFGCGCGGGAAFAARNVEFGVFGAGFSEFGGDTAHHALVEFDDGFVDFSHAFAGGFKVYFEAIVGFEGLPRGFDFLAVGGDRESMSEVEVFVDRHE